MLLNEVFITKCQDEDYRFVYNLSKKNMKAYVEEHWGAWNAKVFRDSFDKNNFWIAKYKKRKIGFYAVANEDNVLYLQSIQIAPSLKGKGLGSFLMKMMEKKAKSNKKKIKLKTFKNNPAKDFFRKMGYEVVDEDKSSLIMEKNL